jgi:hypothetical protein
VDAVLVTQVIIIRASPDRAVCRASRQGRYAPDYRMPLAKGCLLKDSFVNTETLITFSPSMVLQRLGAISGMDLGDAALKYTLDLT